MLQTTQAQANDVVAAAPYLAKIARLLSRRNNPGKHSEFKLGLKASSKMQGLRCGMVVVCRCVGGA
jgi:hypothetical protein